MGSFLGALLSPQQNRLRVALSAASVRGCELLMLGSVFRRDQAWRSSEARNLDSLRGRK